MVSVLQQKSDRSFRSRGTVHSLRCPRVLCLVASLPLFVVTLGATADVPDTTGTSAGFAGSIQEPGAMVLAGLALLGLAFVVRQISGKKRPGSASQ